MADLQTRFYERHAQEAAYPPMAGMADCVLDTHRMGCSHYLFTHRNYRAVEQLAVDGLGEYFIDSVTHEDGFPDKPAPDAILHLLQKHGIPPEEAVMIGDDITVTLPQEPHEALKPV